MRARERGKMISRDVISDSSGYSVCERDLQFLQISEDQFAAFCARRRPLGMSEQQYEHFVSSLIAALRRDGVKSADVRLQGSSAHFFSGQHKAMPWSRPDIVDEFRRARRRVPQPIEVEIVEAKLRAAWPPSGARPQQRPFDVMFMAGIDSEPSDYDIQISSDEIVERARQRISSLGIEPNRYAVVSTSYNFVRKDLIVDTCPFLTQWATLQTDILGRSVTLAVFSASGPPNVESTNEVVSSHFKTTDWIIATGDLNG
jgi:hypothetical protein